MFNFIEAGDIQGFQAQMKEYEKSQLVDILNTKNDAGKTMLHVAVAKGSLEFIRLLCEAGALLNEKDAQQQTPLHIAVANGSYDMVQELLIWDASMTEVDGAGKTALQYAEENSSEEVYGKMAALLRTRQAWQEAAVGFRFNRVVSLLKNAFPEVRPASGHDKVLFIGRTGAGKSTLLNYLNGIRYTRGLDPETGKPFAKPVEGSQVETAKVGQGLISQTLYPQIIKKSPLNYVYCDLAGLFDSRGDEERICAASSVQILSRLPGDIKGIVVVLDLPSFYPRGDAFKQTAVALARMLQQNPDLMDSVYFVITQVPKEVEATLNPEKILTRNVGGILFALKNKAKMQGLDSEELALQFMLEQMQRIGPERILIPKITDLGESRQMMEQKLSNLQAKPANLFNFVSHDNAQESFNYVLSTIAQSFLSRKKQVEITKPEKIAEEQQRQEQLGDQIQNLQDEIQQREIELSNPYDPRQIDNEIATKRNQIQANRNLITQKQNEISNFESELRNFESELARLDTNERIHVNTLNYSTNDRPREHRMEYVSPYALGRINTSYRGYGSLSYTLETPPLTGGSGIDDDGARISYYEWNDDAKNGRYRALFRASEGLISIQVEIHTAKRHMHVARIDELRSLIADRYRQIASARSEVRRLTNENDTLQNEILDCEREKIQEDARAQIRAARLQGEIEKRNEWLTTARLELAASIQRQETYAKELHDIQLELQVNEELFAIVYQVSRILELAGDQNIARFSEEYVKYYPSAEEDFMSFMLQQTAMDLEEIQRAPVGYGSLFHFPQASNNNPQTSPGAQYIRQQGPGF